MECMNDIGAVEFLGVNTLTLGVYDTWVVRGNLAGAAQLALTLLAFMALLLMLERSQRGKSVHYQRAGRQRNSARLSGHAAPAYRDERILPAADFAGLCGAGNFADNAFTDSRLAARLDASGV